ncbi:ribonuclease P protein component [Vallicoccus soli]
MRRPADFAATVRRGPRSARATRGSVVVHLAPAPAADDEAGARGPLVGVVVSRAVGGAVERNLVKRRLRHALRELLAGVPAGARVVVRAQPGAARAPYAVLRADLAAALERVLAGPRRGAAHPR